MRRGRLSGQYGRLSSFTTCWWAGEECRAAVMYGTHWWSRESRATSICSSALASVASLQPLALSRTSAKGGGGGGCSFSETVVVTFSLCRPFPHMFYFFIRLLKITRASSHIFVLICTSSVLLYAGRVKEISSVFIRALHVLFFFFTRSVLSVTESTFFKQIVSFKSSVFSLSFINWHCCFSTISRFVTSKRK